MKDLPVPESDFRERLKRVQEIMTKKGVEGLLVFYEYLEREGNVSYLTNNRSSFPNVMSHRGIGYGAYLVRNEGEGILISPFGYEEEKLVNVYEGFSEPDLIKGVVKAFEEMNLSGKKIAIAGTDILPYEYFEEIKRKLNITVFENFTGILEKMRSIKSENEITVLRKSAAVADAGLRAAMEEAKPGKTEKDVEIAARKAAYEEGADFVSRVRISSGKKVVGLRWPMVTERKIEEGDIVYVDFIGFYKGYGFDAQRIKVAGTASSDQKELLSTALELENWLAGRLSSGVELKFVRMSGRGFKFSPFLHGIGLEICEEPSCVMEGMRVKIEKNMVLCVEPTVGNEAFGELGLEDMYVITDKGAEKLNKLESVFW